jgi:hypothetical protein
MPMCRTPKAFVPDEKKPRSDSDRADRYRRLALAAADNATAELLNTLADEAEQHVLCTADWQKAGTLGNEDRAVDTALSSESSSRYVGDDLIQAQALDGLGPPTLRSPELPSEACV